MAINNRQETEITNLKATNSAHKLTIDELESALGKWKQKLAEAKAQVEDAEKARKAAEGSESLRWTRKAEAHNKTVERLKADVQTSRAEAASLRKALHQSEAMAAHHGDIADSFTGALEQGQVTAADLSKPHGILDEELQQSQTMAANQAKQLESLEEALRQAQAVAAKQSNASQSLEKDLKQSEITAAEKTDELTLLRAHFDEAQLRIAVLEFSIAESTLKETTMEQNVDSESAAAPSTNNDDDELYDSSRPPTPSKTRKDVLDVQSIAIFPDGSDHGVQSTTKNPENDAFPDTHEQDGELEMVEYGTDALSTTEQQNDRPLMVTRETDARPWLEKSRGGANRNKVLARSQGNYYHHYRLMLTSINAQRKKDDKPLYVPGSDENEEFDVQAGPTFPQDTVLFVETQESGSAAVHIGPPPVTQTNPDAPPRYMIFYHRVVIDAKEWLETDPSSFIGIPQADVSANLETVANAPALAPRAANGLGASMWAAEEGAASESVAQVNEPNPQPPTFVPHAPNGLLASRFATPDASPENAPQAAAPNPRAFEFIPHAENGLNQSDWAVKQDVPFGSAPYVEVFGRNQPRFRPRRPNAYARLRGWPSRSLF